jgi:hypothetical protein
VYGRGTWVTLDAFEIGGQQSFGGLRRKHAGYESLGTCCLGALLDFEEQRGATAVFGEAADRSQTFPSAA